MNRNESQIHFGSTNDISLCWRVDGLPSIHLLLVFIVGNKIRDGSYWLNLCVYMLGKSGFMGRMAEDNEDCSPLTLSDPA